ncbi:MAG: helix-turn-helix domain-containing protein [Betaproteobacteria bacterium]|nr:helix-turn-helix domain-containing protein [Betaproteobacteria bacterium]
MPAPLPRTDPSPPAASRTAGDRHFIGALAKGFAVIHAFGEHTQALTLSQVAERTGLTRAGARRYLLTLQELGYAGQNGRHFSLTPKVLSLGYAYLSSMPLWTFAEPILEGLVETLGETCSLSVLDDIEIVYVLRIPVHHILPIRVTVGSRLPAYCTSMGRVLLGGLTEAQLKHYFARAEFRTYAPRTVTDPARLRKIIAADRAKGYSWITGEMGQHISGLSVPVRDPQGRVLAALNISVNRPLTNEKRLIAKLLPKLHRAAEQMNASVAIANRPPR